MISVLYSLKKFCKNSLSKCWISYGLYVSKFSRSSFAFGSSRLWDQLNSKFFSHPPLLSSTPWLRHCNREPWVTQGVWHSLHASFMHSLRKGKKIAGRLEKKCCLHAEWSEIFKKIHVNRSLSAFDWSLCDYGAVAFFKRFHRHHSHAWC